MIKNIKKITATDIAKILSDINFNNKDYELLIYETLKYFMPIQNKLNIELTNNESYAKELITDKGKIINFGSCVLSEANELYNCIPWKHWKDINGDVDYKNFELEIVDQFHFIPSILLCLWDIYPDNQKLTSSFIMLVKNICVNFMTLEPSNFKDRDGGLNIPLLESISGFNAFYGSSVSHLFRMKIFTDESETIFYDCTKLEKMAKDAVVNGIGVLHLLVSIHSELFQISYSESINRIKKLYLVKNSLNILRSKNGYKEGHYEKYWDGKEDNDVALTIAELNPDISIEDLYTKLELEYSKYKKVN